MATKTRTKQQAQKRIEQLREEVEHHRYLYHVLDKQEISDGALDSLKKELADLEQEFPELLDPTSPTQRVGGKPLDKFVSVPHQTRMLSLQDTFTEEELTAWEIRNQKILPGPYEYFVQSKIDGVAVSLIYQDGLLLQAVTRGDGKVGEDVTHNIRTIESIPLRIRQPHTGRLEVRGEIYMMKKDFDQLNQNRAEAGEPLFANPRNVSAGSIRQLDPKIAAARPLRFMAWEITDGLDIPDRLTEYKRLQELGFPVPPDSQLFKSLSQVGIYLAKTEDTRDKQPFLIDGAVIKINDLSQAQRLGIVGKAPRASIAYKYAAEEATTIIEDIVVQVGRTGALTPVAHLKPVRVAGTTVSRASLHNADEIKRKDVRIGDTVIVRKAGDIIPEVIKPLPKLRPTNSKPYTMPTDCPVCHSSTKKEEDGAILRCTNKQCFPQQRERIIHAVSRDAFDIEGLGDKIIEQLLQEGLIEFTPDLWELQVGDLMPLERFADKSAQNLVYEIQDNKDITLPRFLIALGIPQVGIVTAQDLAREFQSLEKIMAATENQLEHIEGIGPKVAPEIAAFFVSPSTKELIRKFKDVGITIQTESTSGPLKNQTFVFTGSLTNMSRPEAKQLVIAKGGKVASTVGQKVDFVVLGTDAGSKEKKAKELGLTILTPKQFQQMIR